MVGVIDAGSVGEVVGEPIDCEDGEEERAEGAFHDHVGRTLAGTLGAEQLRLLNLHKSNIIAN